MATGVQQELISVARGLKWLKVQVGLQDWLHIATKDQLRKPARGFLFLCVEP